jgi:hypothetical protein
MDHVLCYARSVNYSALNVVTVNVIGVPYLPGNPMDDDETLIDCAYRTLYEQTGILADKSLIAEAGLLHHSFNRIHVMDCPFRGRYHVDPDTGHSPKVTTLSRLLQSQDLQNCMRAILPLCHAGIHGWMVQTHGEHSLSIRM